MKINVSKKSQKNEIAYSAARDLNRVCLLSLDLDQHNAQQYILNVSSKVRL